MASQKFIIVLISLVSLVNAYSQVTTPNNNSTFGAQFVGFSGAGPGGTKPLDIRNNFNEPINFFTNSTIRGSFTATGSFQWETSSATGFRSYALGFNTLASADNAFSGGTSTTASGINSFTFGESTIASKSKFLCKWFCKYMDVNFLRLTSYF